MLECTRASNIACLCDMPCNEDGDVEGLGELLKARGTKTDLGNTASCRRTILNIDGLDGINNDCRIIIFLNMRTKRND